MDVSDKKTCVRCVKEYTKVSGLKYQDGNYDLVKLQDKEYQDKLQVQIDYWNKIKKEIEAVRSNGYVRSKTNE